MARGRSHHCRVRTLRRPLVELMARRLPMDSSRGDRSASPLHIATTVESQLGAVSSASSCVGRARSEPSASTAKTSKFPKRFEVKTILSEECCVDCVGDEQRRSSEEDLGLHGHKPHCSRRRSSSTAARHCSCSRRSGPPCAESAAKKRGTRRSPHASASATSVRTSGAVKSSR